MKGADWSRNRQILQAIIVCLGIVMNSFLGIIIRYSYTIVTAITAGKDCPFRCLAIKPHRLGAFTGGPRNQYILFLLN